MNILYNLQLARRLLIEMNMQNTPEFKQVEHAIISTIKNLLAELP